QLRLMLALEDSRFKAPGEGGELQHIRPRFQWTELVSPGAKPPQVVRVEDLYGHPAPALDVTAEGWPADPSDPNGDRGMKPRVQTWVSRDSPPVARALEYPPGPPQSREFTLDGGTVYVDASIEERVITPQAGRKPEPRKCLVIRIRHAKDRPIIAQVRDRR